MSIERAGAGAHALPRSLARLPFPTIANPQRVNWRYAISMAVCHLAALFAFAPWFFSWTGVIVAFVGVYVFGGLGINVCYHRLLTHRGFECPKFLEHALAVIGVCCFQDTPVRWVAVHRRHHEHADEEPDPHSPLVNFFWGHMGWMLFKNDELSRLGIYERYAKDLLRDPFYKTIERSYGWIVIGSWLPFFVVAFAAEIIGGGTIPEAIQFGASIVVWGVFVRTVLVWHITWSVNSLAHMWGYRNYDTDEDSRNNRFVALITSGEGWHNNHHADPRAAKHGHFWWEPDLIYLVIRLLASIGLARDVKMPNPHIVARRGRNRLVTHGYIDTASE